MKAKTILMIATTLLFAKEHPAYCTIIPLTDSTTVRVAPGQGYDERAGLFTARCWTGEFAYGGAQETRIDLSANVDRSEILSDVTASFEGGADLLLASGSVKTTVRSRANTNRLRETLNYRVRVRGKSAFLRNPQLTASMSLLKENDPERFRLLCGDSTVTSTALGGELFVFVNFDFLTAEQLEEFKIKIKVSAMGLSKTKTINKEKVWRDKTARVSIEVVQLGGTPQYLEEATGRLKASCLLYDMSECEALIDALVNYGLGEGGNGFLAQMSVASFPAQEAGLWPSVLSARTGPLVIAETGDTWRETIGERLSRLEANEKAVRSKLQLYPKDSRRAAEFQSLLRSTRHLKDRYIRLGLACNAGRTQLCQLSGEFSEISFNSYLSQAGILERGADFQDFCLIANGDEEVRKTTRVILSALGHAGQTTGDCESADTEIKSISSLNIAGLGLVRLDPLRAATALRALDISGNSIEDLTPLQGLVALETLNIEGNVLQTLQPIRNLPLRNLNAASNQFREVKALAGRHLQKAILHGNYFVNTADIPLTADILIRNNDELCSWQRRNLFDAGIIAEPSFRAYESVNFLPVWSGVPPIDLKPCAIGAPLFDEVNAGLFPAIGKRGLS